LFKKIAVIGLGNSLRRDDGIGVIILECLFNSYKDQRIDYLNFGIASFDLMHRLQDYDAALLIDGIDAGLLIGELKIFDLEEISSKREDEQKMMVSSHELNLKDIFRLSRKLELKTKIYVAGIQVQDVSFGESLSDQLKEKIGVIVEGINRFIQERLL